MFNYKLYNVTSQFGEDGIIHSIFSVLALKGPTKFCVDFGAYDGKCMSNSWNLIHNCQWKGVLIESNQERFIKLTEQFKYNNYVTAVNKEVKHEGENTLDAILSFTECPLNFDLLVVDIDGNDYRCWESLGTYVPKVVCIEFVPFLCVDEFVVNPDKGASLLALKELGKLKGYSLVATTLINAFFVLDEYFYLFKIKDNSLLNAREDALRALIKSGLGSAIQQGIPKADKLLS